MNHAELTAVIGEKAALALEAHAGGEAVYVPKPPRETKAQAVRREWARGVLTPGQIAELCGCHRRTVYKVISPN